MKTSSCWSAAALVVASCSAPTTERVSEPPAVAPAPGHLGETMAEVGRRFERMGRAVQAEDWAFAAYDLHELEEIFEDVLPATRLPDDVHVDVRALAEPLVGTHVPELHAAIGARDRVAFATAFGDVANACNGCHRAAGREFIVVPTAPGDPVPVLSAAPRSVAED